MKTKAKTGALEPRANSGGAVAPPRNGRPGRTAPSAPPGMLPLLDLPDSLESEPPPRAHENGREPRRFRAIWISDLHLGTRGCKARLLLDFLERTESDALYLVGDVIDGWSLRKSWYWDEQHDRVVQRILKKSSRGTRVTYVCGNHDEFLRRFLGQTLGGIRLVDAAVHRTAAGKRLLVVHGDRFDASIRHAGWLAHLGDRAYQASLVLNAAFNLLRRKLGYPYWSLSAWLKHKVKNAVSYVGSFERALLDEARRKGFAGVVCGHIHHAEMREQDGLLYLNDGDWVESCTALVEHADGRLEILRWNPAGEDPARARAPFAEARA